mmetsp:Transcript_40850/g.30065  ORF Transcript_40850/g.30065 Transcript_40850/m.30065 type:complete len:159 (+) Transcript_40850:1818-2294(+)
MLAFLWEEQQGRWEEKHFGFVVNKLLEEDWDEGMRAVFRAPASHVIFQALNAEDKDNFLNQKVIDKVLVGQEAWEHSPLKASEKLQAKVVALLAEEPYGGFAVLKYPSLFEKHGWLRQGLEMVQQNDIVDFLQARKENTRHFANFYLNYKGEHAKLLK